MGFQKSVDFPAGGHRGRGAHPGDRQIGYYIGKGAGFQQVFPFREGRDQAAVEGVSGTGRVHYLYVIISE